MDKDGFRAGAGMTESQTTKVGTQKQRLPIREVLCVAEVARP